MLSQFFSWAWHKKKKDWRWYRSAWEITVTLHLCEKVLTGKMTAWVSYSNAWSYICLYFFDNWDCGSQTICWWQSSFYQTFSFPNLVVLRFLILMAPEIHFSTVIFMLFLLVLKWVILRLKKRRWHTFTWTNQILVPILAIFESKCHDTRGVVCLCGPANVNQTWTNTVKTVNF